MTCHKSEDYEAGKMTSEELSLHLKACSDCREAVRLDVRLERELDILRLPVPDNGLWRRIETALEAEKRAAEARGPERGPSRIGRVASWLARPWAILVPAGAVLLALIILGVGRGPQGRLSASGILENKALAEVEVKERAYIAAIENLERQAGPKLAAMEEPRLALYKEKLATIDAQIGKCRQALATNPANAHIRRYLLAALQDKEQTLADALGSAN